MMTFTKTSVTLILIALLSINTRADAQFPSTSDVSATCPTPGEVTPLHLYGLWRAEFAVPAGTSAVPGATLLFEKHPEFAGSVVGGINRDGTKAQIAGDVDNGVFTLEESDNGQNIVATWNGAVVDGSCGKEIKGTWNNASNTTSYPFFLRKLPGWQ